MDWYRRKTWTSQDEKEFHVRLGRARYDNRPQYLRIQAVELISTDKSELLEVAEKLLLELLEKYKDNESEKSPTFHSLGEIYRKRKLLDKAIYYYKQSLEIEKLNPSVITQSYVDYSELIVKTGQKELYDHVINLIKPQLEHSLFPIEKYRISSLLSVVYKEKGNTELSDYYNQIAETNANVTTSGLRYHKNIGLVKKRKNWLGKLVNIIRRP